MDHADMSIVSVSTGHTYVYIYMLIYIGWIGILGCLYMEFMGSHHLLAVVSTSFASSEPQWIPGKSLSTQKGNSMQ